MPRRTYSNRTRAAVYAALLAYEGNVRRAARENGVPHATVRDWAKKWEHEGPPQEVTDELGDVVDDIVEQLSRVRDKALLELERQIDSQQLKGQALVSATGMLTDKIRLYRGEATSRSESTTALPAPEELRQLVGGMFEEAVAAAQERAEEIEEAEWEPAPLRELPRPIEEVVA